MNAFEQGTRKVIPAVLVYVRSQGRILMLHRNARGAATDYHSGKWNGLGGKCEPDESPLEAAVRETREESGLELPATLFRALGVVQFPNFKAHKHEDWIVFIFTAELSDPKTAAWDQGPEGELHWVPAVDLTQLNLWPGDRHFISYVAEECPFMGTIWYQGQEVVRHWVTGLR